MAFQPMTNDNRAATASQGYDAIARMNMAGTAAIAGGISQAGSALGGALQQGISDWQKRSQQLNANAGTVDALLKTGVLSPEIAAELVGQKDPDKVSGALMVYLQKAQDDAMLNRQLEVVNAQMAGQAEQRAAATGARSAEKPVFGVNVAPGINFGGGVGNGR
jgi:hypothetical protein